MLKKIILAVILVLTLTITLGVLLMTNGQIDPSALVESHIAQSNQQINVKETITFWQILQKGLYVALAAGALIYVLKRLNKDLGGEKQ